MKKNIFIGLNIFLLSIYCYGQDNTMICKVLYEKKKKEVIPYSSVFFVKSRMGGYADEFGRFCISLQNSINYTDSVEISGLGYKRQKLLVRDFLDKDTIYLETEAIKLDTILVKSAYRKTKVREVGYNKKLFEVSNSFCPNSSVKLAVYIPNLEDITEEETLNKIYFKLVPKENRLVKYFRLRVRLFKHNENSNFPENDILLESITIDVSPSQNEALFNIGKYNIKFPKNGIWLSIECVGYIDKNESYISIKDYQFSRYTLKQTKRFRVESIERISPFYMYVKRKDAISAESNWSNKWIRYTFEKNLTFCFGAELVR